MTNIFRNSAFDGTLIAMAIVSLVYPGSPKTIKKNKFSPKTIFLGSESFNPPKSGDYDFSSRLDFQDISCVYMYISIHHTPQNDNFEPVCSQNDLAGASLATSSVSNSEACRD